MKQIKQFIKKYFSGFAYFYRYLRNKIFIAFLFSIVVSIMDGLGLSMFLPLLQAVGKGNNIDGSGMGNLHFIIDWLSGLGIGLTLGSILIVMFLFFTFKGLAKYFSGVYLVVLQQRFIRTVRIKLLKQFNNLNYKKFINSNVGRIQNTMTVEVNRVSNAFMTYFKTIQQIVMVVVYMGFAFFLNAQFAILVTIGGGLTYIIYNVIYKHTKGASRKLTGHNNIYQGQIVQHVSNFKYLKATGTTRKYAKKLEKTIYDIEASQRKIGVLNSVSNAVREPMLIGIIALVIFVQTQFLGGDMGPILISLLFFYRALSALADTQVLWNSYLGNSGSLENLQDFEQNLELNKEEDGKVKIKAFQKHIVLNEVSFSYGDTHILSDIQLHINKNETLAFVGESGSGKTTLVNLIAGLMAENEGTIYIDDIPLKNIKRESYRERIGYVSQDPVIFNDSIYNNVTFWAEQTPKNIAHFKLSIKQAALHNFVDELPKGKDTELGNNGINLSGGQKQRISIARELYKSVDILILDEATSALDSETEKAIQKSIDALQGQYTILIVAHRLSTIRNVNRIVLMDKGHIIAINDFKNLLNKQESFKKMVEMQEL